MKTRFSDRERQAAYLASGAGYNITPRGRGTSARGALRRLRTQRPDLHEDVIQGKLSPHRAMVQAGFRRPTATVYVDSAEAAVQGLLRRFERDELLRALDVES